MKSPRCPPTVTEEAMEKSKKKALVTPVLEKTQALPPRVKSSRELKEKSDYKPVTPHTFGQTFPPQLVSAITSPRSTNLDKILERRPSKIAGSKSKAKESMATHPNILETESAQSEHDFAVQAKRLSKEFAELR